MAMHRVIGRSKIRKTQIMFKVRNTYYTGNRSFTVSKITYVYKVQDFEH